MNTENENNVSVDEAVQCEVTENSTEMETKDCGKLKLNYPQTLKVGLGFAVVMIFWQVYNFVVPLLLEDAFGFSNTIRNLIVGIASAMCIVLLPVFGKFSDKCRSRFGRRTPFIVIGTVITIVAMVLVPVSVQKQLTDSAVIKSDWGYFFQVENNTIEMTYASDDLSDYGINKGDVVTRAELLGAWFDMAKSGNYSVITKASFNDLMKGRSEAEAREYFQGLYNPSVSNDGLLGVIGTKNYYKDIVLLDSTVDGARVYMIYSGKAGTVSTYNSATGETKVLENLTEEQKTTLESCKLSKADYDKLSEEYIQFSSFLADAAQNHTASNVQAKVNWGWFAFFLVALVLIILAQTVIRTPAVSLMPDVTPSPLRSPGNAMINLVGGVGGGIGFIIYTVTFLLNMKVSTQYWIIFGVLAAALAIVLALFIALVREPKWVAECNRICKEYGLPTSEDQPKEEETNEPKQNMFKKYGAKKMISFFLILASIFMWFIGYYAIANNMSIYCVKILNVSAGIASIVSGASLVVSAIGFIPVGIMAKKVGRRLSIILGYGMAIISYILVAACVRRGSDTATVIFMVCYMVSGFGLIFANVNTLPMVLELSTPKDIGTFTGIYYIATMSAQTLGPIFGGIVMDNIGGSSGIFIFSAVAVGLAGLLMAFVKHGEAPDYVAKVEARRQAKLQAKTAGAGGISVEAVSDDANKDEE